MLQKVGSWIMDEKTRVSLSIVTFFTLILFMISTVYAATTWKTQMEEMNKSQNKQIYENTRNVKENNTVLVESQIQFAEIQADLKWIINDMREDK